MGLNGYFQKVFVSGFAASGGQEFQHRLYSLLCSRSYNVHYDNKSTTSRGRWSLAFIVGRLLNDDDDALQWTDTHWRRGWLVVGRRHYDCTVDDVEWMARLRRLARPHGVGRHQPTIHAISVMARACAQRRIGHIIICVIVDVIIVCCRLVREHTAGGRASYGLQHCPPSLSVPLNRDDKSPSTIVSAWCRLNGHGEPNCQHHPKF